MNRRSFFSMLGGAAAAAGAGLAATKLAVDAQAKLPPPAPPAGLPKPTAAPAFERFRAAVERMQLELQAEIDRAFTRMQLELQAEIDRAFNERAELLEWEHAMLEWKITHCDWDRGEITFEALAPAPRLIITDIDLEDKVITLNGMPVYTDPRMRRDEILVGYGPPPPNAMSAYADRIWFCTPTGCYLRPGENDVRIVNIQAPEPDQVSWTELPADVARVLPPAVYGSVSARHETATEAYMREQRAAALIAGRRINWSHPLARGLKSCTLFREGEA